MEQKTKIYLAVRDSEASRFVRSTLERGEHRIQEAMDWGLVPEEVGLFGADVVLLSEDLPGAPLKGVLAKLKEDPRTQGRPVIVLLKKPDDGAVSRVLEAGADDWLPSPPLAADLVNKVRLHGRRRLPDSVDLPDLLLTVSDEVAPAESGHSAREDRITGTLRALRGLPDGIPPGMDGHYEHDVGVIIEVSEALASSLSPSDALYVLVRRISQNIPAHRCNVLVQGARPDEAFVVASHDDSNLRKEQVDLRKYPEVRRCIENGEVVVIEDVRKDPEMEEVLDFITMVDLRSALVHPLFVREVPVGTLSLTTRREKHGFTRRELMFVRAMANVAAGILATSQLLEEVRRQAAAAKPPLEELDEVVLDIEDQIDGLIEELERK
jgi:CheY-like chemotaxis protein